MTLQVIEVMGEENVKMNTKQVEEVLSLLRKEAQLKEETLKQEVGAKCTRDEHAFYLAKITFFVFRKPSKMQPPKWKLRKCKKFRSNK